MAYRDNAVVGVLSVHIIPLFHAEGNLGRITSLVVTKSARTHGVGKALVQAAEDFGNSHGCVRVEVTTGEHRPEAHLFYEKMGFCQVDRRFVKGARLSGAGDSPLKDPNETQGDAVKAREDKPVRFFIGPGALRDKPRLVEFFKAIIGK